MKKVAKDYDNITLFNAFDSLCDGNICPIIKNGKLLYRDDDHVSNEGARMIAKDLLNIIFKWYKTQIYTKAVNNSCAFYYI